MKIESIYDQAIYPIPSVTRSAICFLFWIFWFEKSYIKTVVYPTPHIALCWYKKHYRIFLSFLNWQVVINLNKGKLLEYYRV